MSTKIAIATEDGTRISAHFGRAPYFEIVTVSDGKIVSRERRAKAFHQTHEHHDHHHGDAAHGDMLAAARDCVAIIAGGMGNGAYAFIQSAGIAPIITDEHDIERAARAYAAGTLPNRIERLH
ncbi:MAG: dinitrogenase iron-molybdenum cofactor biosynthesis protein [Chloroflexi bacterium]|nr:dinitrogenase iron-molybdenum cofactor biosynthesis protein [Chloroflexota bacterium]